jgi:hypothetical protein
MKFWVVLLVALHMCLVNESHAQELRPDVKARILDGSLRLENSIFNTFGTGSDELKSMVEKEQWEELAAKVLSKGFISNIYYYLLGRSAEGLGSKEAAKIYYQLAVSRGPYDCKTYMFGERCLGLNIPQEVRIRLESLGVSEGAALTAQRSGVSHSTKSAPIENRNVDGAQLVSFIVLNERIVPIAGASVKAGFLSRLESGEKWCGNAVGALNVTHECVTDGDGKCHVYSPLVKHSASLHQLCGRLIEVGLPTSEKILSESKPVILARLKTEQTPESMVYRVYVDGTSFRATAREIPKLADVVQRVTLQDERLETSIKVNTKGTRALWTKDSSISDLSFIRAWVDRQSLKRTFQVYSHVDYEGDWRFFNRVNFETPNGLQSRELVKIDSNVYKYSDRTFRKYEDVGFDIDESTLRSIAANYIDGSDATFDYKLLGKAGDKTFRLPVFEISAILSVVDRLPKPSTSSSTQINQSAQQPSASGVSNKLSPEARLQNLKSLLDKGLLSKQEYESKRQEILKDL